LLRYTTLNWLSQLWRANLQEVYSLILLDSERLILHIEFQTEPDPTMPFRLTDYRLRIYRRFPNKQVRQIVIYLKPTSSELVYQDVFEIPRMRYEFEVIRLWEQPTQPFLESTGLLPLAVLTKTSDKTQNLRQVASRVEAISDLTIQSNVAASAGILAGLLLKRDFINQVLRKEIMQESVIYQEIEQGGIVKGKLEEGQSLILRLLTRRIGALTPSLQSQIQALSLSQLEVLAEALLDFSEPSDLANWLRSNS
jgi:predicted transposase/invertase (TIGR01784 family)